VCLLASAFAQSVAAPHVDGCPTTQVRQGEAHSAVASLFSLSNR
jgi:hypothetical protein